MTKIKKETEETPATDSRALSAPMIYSRIPAIMAEVEAIEKGRRNAAQGYSFRGIDDMYNALHPLFAKHQVFITKAVLSETRTERTNKNGAVMFCVVLKVRFTYFAPDGSSIIDETVGEGMDSGDKATNKALSAAFKYSVMQLLMIPTEEEKDSEVHTPEIVAQPQHRQQSQNRPAQQPAKPQQAQQPQQQTPPPAPAPVLDSEHKEYVETIKAVCTEAKQNDCIPANLRAEIKERWGQITASKQAAIAYLQAVNEAKEEWLSKQLEETPA
jgi:hypothetical protein